MSAWEPQLSDWIDGSVKPTIVGVYQRRFDLDEVITRYALWDGARWHASWPTVTAASLGTALSTHRGAFHWRGLAKDPAAWKVLAS